MKKTSLFLFIVCLNIAYIQTDTASAQTAGTQLQKLDSVVASDYTKYIYSYNESGQIVSEKFYVATDSVKKLFTLMNLTEHIYDNGKKVSKVFSYSLDGVMTASSRNMYEYSEDRISIDRLEYAVQKQWKTAQKTDYFYENPLNKLTKIVTSLLVNDVYRPAEQSEYTYDAENNCLLSILGKKLNYKNEWTSNTKTEFGYNSGNLIVRTDFHWNDTVKAWAPDTKTEYIYNTTNTNMVVYKESKYSGGGFVVVLEKEITMDRACSTDKLLLPVVSNIPFKVEEEKVLSSQRLSQYYYSPHIGNGIINPTENRNALIYPNPARDFVNIQLAQFPSEPVTVKIFNNSGKLLLSQPIGNNGETISLKSFPVGIYLLQLENGRNKELVKVIKQ